MTTSIDFDRSMDATQLSTVANERHFSPVEVGEMWNLSADCIRKIFENERGVLMIRNAQPKRGKRNYRTLRIPQSVLDRVHRRLRKV